MAVIPNPGVAGLLADEKAIQKIMNEQNAAMRFVKDPDATPQKARAMMLALGIRPEDNEFSRGIVAARDEE